MAENYSHNSEENDGFLQEFDINKLLRILLRSSLWIILLTALPISVAYLYLRYTKPMYMATSNIKLETKNKNSILGIPTTAIVEDDIYGEIEFIRSDIIYEAVISKTDLWVTYYAQGQILDSERYGNSPFKVTKYTISNPNFYNKEFYVQIIDEQRFELSYLIGETTFKKQYKFGQNVRTQDFQFKLIPTNALRSETTQYFTFVIHDKNTLINYIRANLVVDIVNAGAKIISISFREHSPEKASYLVNVIDTVYLEKTLAEKNKSNRQQLEYLDEQLETIQEQLGVYEEKIAKFLLENQTRNVETKIENSLAKVETLIEERTKTQAKLEDIRELEAYIYQENEQEDLLPIPIYQSFEGISSYISELNELKKRRANMLYYKKESTSAIQRMNQEISVSEQNLQKIIMRFKADLFKQIQKINEQISAIQAGFGSLPEKSNEYTRINRLYQIYESYYLKMLDRKAEIGVAGAGIIPEFVILSPATVPSEPISPKKLSIYGIALVIGLFLDFLLIGVLYLLANSIINQKELEKVLKIPLLGAVPRSRRMRKKDIYSRLLVNQYPKSSLNESLRAIRTNLDFLFPNTKQQRKTRIISITSTVSGEGKTFVAVNLGGIIALSSKKVVVLDLDLRKPKVHLAFGKMEDENTRGVSTILIGQHLWKECVRHSTVENLDYISSGPTPPNPSELILQESFSELLHTLGEEYDVILIDTPPVGIVTDAMLIMQQVDVPLYVFRAGVSKRFFAKNANQLASQNFSKLAAILNDVRQQKQYGYGYGYGNYGGYYEENNEDTNLLFRLLSVLKKKN